MKTLTYFGWLGMFLAVAISLGVIGCGSMEDLLAEDPDNPVIGAEPLTAVLYSEIRDPNICSRNSFAAGEVPAIKIQGCGGKEVRLLVIETEAGRLIVGQTVRLKNGQTYYRPLPHIPPGRYKISMAGQGVPRSSYAFTVSN